MSELISDGKKLIRLASKRSDQMMVAYRANLKRGGQNVRDMILEDIRRFSELGALAYVDDLKEVLLRFDELAPFHPSAAKSAVTVAY